MNLAQKLKILRARDGRTQEEIAGALKQIGINANRVQIARWENGLQEPTLNPVRGLAKLYGVTLDSLIVDEWDLPAVDGTTASLRPAKEKKAENLNLKNANSEHSASKALPPGKYPRSDERTAQTIYRTEDCPDFTFTEKMSGDSMSPSIKANDLIFLTAVEDYADGQIYLVNIGERKIVRRCYFAEKTVRLVPDNPAFPILTIQNADLSEIVLFRVRAWTRQ